MCKEMENKKNYEEKSLKLKEEREHREEGREFRGEHGNHGDDYEFCGKHEHHGEGRDFHGKHGHHGKGHGRGEHGHHGEGRDFHGEHGEHGQFELNFEELQEDTIVCKCKRVTYGDMVKAVEQGASTYEEVSKITNCGVGCERCIDSLRKLTEKLVNEKNG